MKIFLKKKFSIIIVVSLVTSDSMSCSSTVRHCLILAAFVAPSLTVGLNFYRILILGLDLYWRDVRLGKLVLHYIEF